MSTSFAEGWTSGFTRLGASVEELAIDTLQELLGYAPVEGEHAQHKPARADIQKIQNVYDLYRTAQPSGVSSLTEEQISEAYDKWMSDYTLTKDEQNLIKWYTMEYRNTRSADAAFHMLARVMDATQGRVTPNDELHPPQLSPYDEEPTPEGKKAAGALLKKYEENGYRVLYPTIVRALSQLMRERPVSYKLWPWAVKAIKTDYQHKLMMGSVPDIGSAPINYTHFTDVVGEAGDVLSRLRAENRLPQNFDINRLDFKELEEWLMQWKRDNRETEAQGEIVYKYHDNWTMQKLTTPDQLQYEGDEMGHCVGGYAQSVGMGRDIIYSLRDPKGKPHVTIEIDALEGPQNLLGWGEDDELPEDAIYNHEYIHPDEHAPGDHMEERVDRDHREVKYRPSGETPFEVVQVQGNQNTTPKPEYQRKVREFLDSLREKGWKFVRSDNWYAPHDQHGQYDPEESDGIECARDLDNWFDNDYKTRHEEYRGVNQTDPYGLPAERASINIRDWEELLQDCAHSLIDEYDRGKWRGRWTDLAQAVYHAWNLDTARDAHTSEQLESAKQELLNAIQSGEEQVFEWEHDNSYYALQDATVRERIVEKAKEKLTPAEWNEIEQKVAEQHGFSALADVEEGEEPWDDDDLLEVLREEQPEAFDDALYEEVTKWYTGDVHKFYQYLYMLAEKKGMANPGDLPDPNERHGGLPAFEELEQMPWSKDTPVEKGLPGAMSKVASEIQIHPIDQEHNIWFDEDGNQHERYRPGWVRVDAGKMHQTGDLEDTFLDKQGRQGQGYVAYHGDKPIGSLTYVDDPAGWYMLGTTYVHPDYREQGIFNRLAAPLRESGKPVDAYVWNNPWLKQKVRSWQMS